MLFEDLCIYTHFLLKNVLNVHFDRQETVICEVC